MTVPAAADADATTPVFAYGSLLDPASFATTVRARTVGDCEPATARGWRRDFRVAFPNDGSQSDKCYTDRTGHRPAIVLFADLVPAPPVDANGILFDATPDDLGRLRDRERRYALDTLTVETAQGQVVQAWTFLGRPEFTHPRDTARGVCPRSYLHRMIDGATFWDTRSTGFLAAFHASTTLPDDDRVADLTRHAGPPVTP